MATVRPWCRPSSTAAGLRTGSPATCSTVTVFSLSVSRQDGHPPARRSATSTAPATEGHVLSSSGRTTRYRDQASHRQNSVVFTCPISGPSPKSYCAHIPGSGMCGRCTRRRPAKYDRLISATARRVVRSDPPYPIAVIVSCATSARIFPFDRSASSSSLARNGPVTPARRAGPAGTARPRSRSATYRATV